MYAVIDIETIPDQTPNVVKLIEESMEIKAPDLTKPKIIDALGLDPKDGKFKTVPELKEDWIAKFGAEAKTQQANEKWLKTSFDGGKGQICHIAFTDGEHDISISVSDFDFYEDRLLNYFWQSISGIFNGRCPMLVAHNASFDLPFLYHRSVIHRVKPAVNFKPYGRHGSDYFCTMEAWAGFKGKVGLDRLSGLLDIKGKDGMNGADVWPAYQDGKHKEIGEYCLDDVRITHEVYKRLTFS